MLRDVVDTAAGPTIGETGVAKRVEIPALLGAKAADWVARVRATAMVVNFMVVCIVDVVVGVLENENYEIDCSGEGVSSWRTMINPVRCC